MPNWTHTPPDDPRGHGLPLVRTPAARSLKAIATCDHLIGTDTHFWGGHTVPCLRPKCDACHNGIRYEWHGYISAFNQFDQLHFIFEVTAQAARAFADYHQEHKTLRCCAFEAYRWKHTRNGRVIIKCERSAVAPHALPPAPDLCKIMSIIWRLPANNVQEDGNRSTSRRPHLDVHLDGDGQSSDPRDYAVPINEPVAEAVAAVINPNGRRKQKRRLAP